MRKKLEVLPKVRWLGASCTEVCCPLPAPPHCPSTLILVWTPGWFTQILPSSLPWESTGTVVATNSLCRQHGNLLWSQVGNPLFAHHLVKAPLRLSPDRACKGEDSSSDLSGDAEKCSWGIFGPSSCNLKLSELRVTGNCKRMFLLS